MVNHILESGKIFREKNKNEKQNNYLRIEIFLKLISRSLLRQIAINFQTKISNVKITQ